MRDLVRARVKPGGERSLLQAIEKGTLGKGSVAGGEYLRNMQAARLCEDGTARWVEFCYWPISLQEERPRLGAALRTGQGSGHPCSQPVPRLEWIRAVGL